MRTRSLTAIATVAVALALAGCGGGGTTASAGTTTTTTTAPATAPAAGQRGGGGGGRFGAAAQAFVQCLRDDGLEVGNLTAGGGGGGGGGGGEFPRPPGNGSRPAPPAGGSTPQGQFRRDPTVMAQRLAQRLGLDTTNESVAADVAGCTAKLG